MTTSTVHIVTVLGKLPSECAVGEVASNWYIAKRRGNRVRHRNAWSGAWDKWVTLEPGDAHYVEPAQDRITGQMDPAVTVPAEPRNLPATSIVDDDRMPRELENIQHEAEKHGYASMTKADLLKLAAWHDIPNRSKMLKAELVIKLNLEDARNA